MQNWPIIVVVLLVAAYVAWRIFASRRRHRPKPPPIEEIDAFMKYFAGEAVYLAKTMGVVLDRSEGSMKCVDDALEKIREEYLRTKSEKGMFGLAITFGAYVGEVIRLNESAAHWAKDHPEIGPNTFPLLTGVNDESLFPVAWCHKRILNGEEDSIVVKLKVVQARRRSG